MEGNVGYIHGLPDMVKFILTLWRLAEEIDDFLTCFHNPLLLWKCPSWGYDGCHIIYLTRLA